MSAYIFMWLLYYNFSILFIFLYYPYKYKTILYFYLEFQNLTNLFIYQLKNHYFDLFFLVSMICNYYPN